MSMRPINADTPRDRQIILGYEDYRTQWLGRWDHSKQEFLPRCRPDNEHGETTWEHPDSWDDLPGWATDKPQTETPPQGGAT